MKKLFALILALVLAFCAGWTKDTTTVTTEVATQTTETKIAEWANAYYGKPTVKKINKTNRVRMLARRAGRILALPMLLAIGSGGSATRKTPVMVQYELNGAIKSKVFQSAEEGFSAYRQIATKQPNLPRQIKTAGTPSIVLANHGWTNTLVRRENAEQWKDNARTRLEACKGLKKAVIAAVLAIRVSDLKKVIVGRNTERLMEIPGIGEKTAYKILDALEPICKAEPTIRAYGTRTFIRATLNPKKNGFDFDSINKGVSPVEAKAIAIGGDNAIVHVTSIIPDAKATDIESLEMAEDAAHLWRQTVMNGLVINGTKYVFLGHGTNNAKECKTLWVKESIYAEMRTWILKDTNTGWLTTVAKKVAYLVGLQAVPRKSFGIPFIPEDCAIMPSVWSEIVGNHTKEFLDGHEEQMDNNRESEIRSDGYSCIEIPEQMVPVFVNRLIQQGVDPEEAAERIEAFMADHSVVTIRANGAAIKSCCDRNFAAHRFLHENGIHTMPDGRPIDQISVFMDETVLKTNIGNATRAYTTFEAWCDAVRSEFDLGVCVRAHAPEKKDTSYQVVQTLTEASDESLALMAEPTIKRINGAHTVDGASKMLGRELGHIARILPTFLNVRAINERFVTSLTKDIDLAFSGKILRNSYYAKALPDPVYVFQAWFGLERTGSLEVGEAWIPGFQYGEFACSRSPVVHPNSDRVLRNVAPKAAFKKYFKTQAYCVYFNCYDDTSRAFAMDFDGDGVKFSFEKGMIQATKETLARWNRLIIWEAPETDKQIVSREDELVYAGGLTHKNQLGLTVFNENGLLNRVNRVKDPVTGEYHYELVEISERGVNFKVFAANVLVDASKHGGADFNEPRESQAATNMVQPLAKLYKDAVARHATRNELEKLASMDGVDRTLMVSTLNRLFMLYSDKLDRSTEIYDLPEGKFDYHMLMFDPEEGRRGMWGLIRKGNNPIMLDGAWCRPDEGLFNALARRIETDRQLWTRDETRKDQEDTSFEDDWRVAALSEISEFAESFGLTLINAYDVITCYMFTKCDIEYADPKVQFLRDQLWRAYWMIFGGLAEKAAMRFEKEEEAAE